MNHYRRLRLAMLACVITSVGAVRSEASSVDIQLQQENHGALHHNPKIMYGTFSTENPTVRHHGKGWEAIKTSNNEGPNGQYTVTFKKFKSKPTVVVSAEKNGIGAIVSLLSVTAESAVINVSGSPSAIHFIAAV